MVGSTGIETGGDGPDVYLCEWCRLAAMPGFRRSPVMVDTFLCRCISMSSMSTGRACAGLADWVSNKAVYWQFCLLSGVVHVVEERSHIWIMCRDNKYRMVRSSVDVDGRKASSVVGWGGGAQKDCEICALLVCE